MKFLFKFHHILKNFVISSSYLPQWLTKIFGRVDGLLMYWLYGSRFCPAPHKAFPYIATLLEPGDTYIDIGAALGQMVAVAQTAVGKHGQVYAFEPQTSFFQRLVHLSNIFGWSNVTLFQSLVGNQNGHHALFENPNGRISSIFSEWEGGVPISHPITTLDQWAKRVGISTADLIKIDVEGAELEVIQGGRRFLKKANPILILEINNREFRQRELGYTVDDILSALEKLGYREFYTMRTEGPAPIESSRDLLESDQDMLAKAGNRRSMTTG